MINIEEENSVIPFAIGGLDIKVYFVKDGVEIYVPEVQGVFYKGASNRPTLTVNYIIFDHDPIESHKNSQIIRLKAATDLGVPVSICEFTIDSSEEWIQKSWGVTIDDIVTEAHIFLYARESKPWTKV